MGKQSTSLFYVFNIVYGKNNVLYFNGCYGYDNIHEAMIALMTMMMTNNHDDDENVNDDNGDDEDGLAGKALCCIVMAVVADLSVT